MCCETGLYPVTQVEFEYLLEGIKKLPKETVDEIRENIKKAKEQNADKSDGFGYYQCPFLINKGCSIYEHRAIVCRTYGLLQFLSDENGKDSFYIPCCVTEGLNYSSVYDADAQKISSEKYKESGLHIEPLSFNIGLKYLYKCEFAGNIDFGEHKNLIDWFE